MELKERLAEILKEKRLKQRELAALLGVTESYVSALLSGRNQRISQAVANLLEEKLGYRSEWVLTGQGEKTKLENTDLDRDKERQELLERVRRLDRRELDAVRAFLDILDKLNR